MVEKIHEIGSTLASNVSPVYRLHDPGLLPRLIRPKKQRSWVTCLVIVAELILFHSSSHATKLVTYYFRGDTRLGVWTEDGVIDLNRAYREMLRERGVVRAEEMALALVPPQMLAFLRGEEGSMNAARDAIEWAKAKKGKLEAPSGKSLDILKEAGIWFEHSEIRLGPPVPDPPHLLAVGFNYVSHSTEINVEVPKHPNIFTKEGKVIGAGQVIEIPESVTQPDYEGELAFVIGRRARSVAREYAYDYVAGYMVFNDVTSRDFQFRVSQYTLGKSADTFSVMGPFLVLKDEIRNPHSLRLTTRVGKEVVQESNTSNMIFTVADLVAYISQVMTLEPGTVITTGTPAGVGFGRKPPRFLKPGDTVSVEIEGLGTLENKVRQRNTD
jgi:acylpyruvate hydrolase